MNEDLDSFIDVLHAIKIDRAFYGSGIEMQKRADELVSMLVRMARVQSRGGPTFVGEIAKRVIEAESNYDAATGKTYCGQMAPPA